MTIIQQIIGTIVFVVVVWLQAINGHLAGIRKGTLSRTALRHATGGSR